MAFGVCSESLSCGRLNILAMVILKVALLLFVLGLIGLAISALISKWFMDKVMPRILDREDRRKK